MFQDNDIPTNLYAAVFESMADSVVTIDLNGVITSWNRAAVSLYGYSAAEAIGKSLSLVLVPEEMPALLRNIDLIKSGQVVEMHDTLRIHKQGKKMTLEVSLSPVKDDQGKVIGLATLARDVTGCRKLAAAGISNENRLKILTDSVPQIIWENDLHGKAIYFNQRFLDYAGLSSDELLGKGWEAIVHPGETLALTRWQRSLLNAETFESEVLLRRADGNYQWHLLRNVPLKNDAGMVTGWFGSATNIDELKVVQTSLKQTTERLHTTLETAVDFAIITMDKDGYVIDWNSGAEQIFGYDKTEAIGQHGDFIFTEEDKYGDIPFLEFHQAAATGRSLDERWHIRKDHARFFMSGVMAPIIQNGSVTGYVKIARNITERKLAEEALLLSQDQRNGSLQFTGMGNWEWNIIENSMNYSENAQSVLGLVPGGAMVRTPFFDSLIIADDMDLVQHQLQNAIGGLNIFSVQCRIERGDNAEQKWLHVYGRIIRHNNSRPLTMIGVLYDITEQKMLENEKDDFINIASHELKTPVTSLKAYSDLLVRLLNEGQPAVIAQRLRQQADRLVKLIHNLLDSTSISGGQMQLHLETFDINELISELVDELRPVAGDHKIYWTPAAVPLVKADKERVRQVVTNFVTNSIKYSPVNGPIFITANDAFDHMLVKVRDTGAGISTEEQTRIFQRYRRSGKSEMRRHAGLGLGLYISSEIIRLHQGNIGVNSTPGQGSDFYFTLPYR